jgi:alkaline phosphatase D
VVDLTRRRFLQVAGAGATALLLGPAVGAARADDPEGVFVHGVASGDPLPDGVMLWTRVTPPGLRLGSSIEVDWVVARDDALLDVVACGTARTTAGRDWTVKVDVRRLQPGTTYFYGFRALRGASPVGRTRTASAGSPDRARFAVVTCGDYNRGLFHAYGRVAERNDLDAVIHLGDYIYEHGRQDRVRPHVPAAELRTLDDYRARYAQYRLDPHLAAMHRSHPVIWVWDDHETVNGAWSTGAENHDAEDGDFGVRAAAALQAALEWLPIRSPDPRRPERIYRRFAFGDLVDLLMLDTRRIGRDKPVAPNLPNEFFRQTGDFTDPKRHILGAEQEEWLISELRSSTATWRFLGNQVVLSPLKIVGAPDATGQSVYANADQWDGYAPARDRVLDAIVGGKVSDVVVLTGDVHASMAFEVARDVNNPAAYDPVTSRGALAVELVTPSISSASDPSQLQNQRPEGLAERVVLEIDQALRIPNPHLKHVQAKLNGYLLVDVDRQRVRAEFWLVPRVTSPTNEQSMNKAFVVRKGKAQLVDA